MSPQCSGTETKIRQLIVNGKTKTALDSAKDFHKQERNASSEALLIDAYLARIQALSDQNLALEAKSLIAIVRERFPAAMQRLEALNATASARGGNLDDLLRGLNEAGVSAERRASIELVIQNEVTDLAALAGCAALPAEHALRRAAAAIDRAFNVVTSGPVTDEQIALPEVSHRSPLAPWKLLIHAIAAFYQDRDKSCEEYLAAIKPESAPGRLVGAMRAMLAATSGAKHSLKPAESALVSRTSVSLDQLRAALAHLDRSFAHADNPGHVFKSIRAAVRECRQSAPDLLTDLQRTIFIKGEAALLDPERMVAALEGTPRQDAAFFRDLARALEHTGDSEDLMRACEAWDSFRLEAVREGWFAERGIEAAALYLHMAGLLVRIPPALLKDTQQPIRGPVSKESRYFQFPEELFARACALDPHADAFSRWLRWAKGRSVREAENVASAWNKALPTAIEPLLFLMNEAEKRNAFPTALSYLNKAELIDAVNPSVRAARLRLLAAGALRHLQQKKPHLAAQRLAEIEALPQSKQGHRPAIAGALRYLICLSAGDKARAAEARLDVERAIGDSLAAILLIFGCAASAKQDRLVALPALEILSEQQRSRLPASMAKVIVAAKEIGINRFHIPTRYLDETEVQFPDVAASLGLEEVRALGEMGISTDHPLLAWAASAAGLERGGQSEAYFLLLRARALPEGQSDRFDALTAAAAELGRFHRDMEVVDRAVEATRSPFDDDPLKLTHQQAREVLRKEKESAAYPSRSSPGPDYSDLFDSEPCMCPACRAKRGLPPDEVGAPYLDEEEMKRSFFAAAPDYIPQDVLPALFEVAKEVFRTGADPDELMSHVLEGGGKNPAGKKKRGRRW